MASATVLIADDDRAIRMVLEQALERAGHTVRSTDRGTTLWRWIEAGDGDVVLTDVVMPDADGLDLVPRIRALRPDLKVIVMSAQTTLLTAIKAAERGAFEYLPKPFDLNELIAIVARALSEPGEKTDVVPREKEDIQERSMIGRSPAMQDIYRAMARLMGTDLTVMISGESGTGKELVARALHDFGKRKDGPFVAINMAAIPRELIESDLFGHEKGAFTGATQQGVGRFRQAQGGSLFLDEIGDMPLDAQTRLLRVLQDGEYTTVGGRVPIRSDVRIIAATHRNLIELIAAGLFREDLYYRLNVVPMRIPPLRERVGDIAELVRYFLDQAAAEGLPIKTIDDRAMELLGQHRWPGNVRELENLVRRVAALYSEDVIGAEIIAAELAESRGIAADGNVKGEGLSALVERHLAQYFDAHRDNLPASGLYDRVLREVERPLILLSLSATLGNQLQTARMLGLNRNTLRKKIRELGIEVVRGVK